MSEEGAPPPGAGMWIRDTRHLPRPECFTVVTVTSDEYAVEMVVAALQAGYAAELEAMGHDAGGPYYRVSAFGPGP